MEFQTLVYQIGWTKVNFKNVNLLSNRNIDIPFNQGKNKKNKFTIRLTNMSTGADGLNIFNLRLGQKESAKHAIDVISSAISYAEKGLNKIEEVLPELNTAIKQDEVITTFDLTGNDKWIVKKTIS